MVVAPFTGAWIEIVSIPFFFLLFFNVADVGIVGDLFQIVPKLTEKVKEDRAKSAEQ